MSSIFQFAILQKTHEQFPNSLIRRTNNPKFAVEYKKLGRK